MKSRQHLDKLELAVYWLAEAETAQRKADGCRREAAKCLGSAHAEFKALFREVADGREEGAKGRRRPA